MTAPEPTRPAEHIDAVARQPASIVGEFIDDAALMHACRSIGTVASFNVATDLLTSTDPRVHEALAASLPAEVMLAALARREPECKECAAFIDSRCIGCKRCNHSWRDDCGCDLKSCGCGEARRDREAVTP